MVTFGVVDTRHNDIFQIARLCDILEVVQKVNQHSLGKCGVTSQTKDPQPLVIVVVNEAPQNGIGHFI